MTESECPCDTCAGTGGHIHITGGGGHASPANAMTRDHFYANSGKGYRAEVNAAWKRCPTCHGSGLVAKTQEEWA